MFNCIEELNICLLSVYFFSITVDTKRIGRGNMTAISLHSLNENIEYLFEITSFGFNQFCQFTICIIKMHHSHELNNYIDQSSSGYSTD